MHEGHRESRYYTFKLNTHKHKLMWCHGFSHNCVCTSTYKREHPPRTQTGVMTCLQLNGPSASDGVIMSKGLPHRCSQSQLSTLQLPHEQTPLLPPHGVSLSASVFSFITLSMLCHCQLVKRRRGFITVSLTVTRDFVPSSHSIFSLLCLSLWQRGLWTADMCISLSPLLPSSHDTHSEGANVHQHVSVSASIFLSPRPPAPSLSLSLSLSPTLSVC